MKLIKGNYRETGAKPVVTVQMETWEIRANIHEPKRPDTGGTKQHTQLSKEEDLPGTPTCVESS